MIERALRLGYRMRSLLLLEQRVERFGRLAPEGVPVYAATGELMRSITGFAVHRGVLASFDRKPLPGVDELVRDARRVVVLEDVNNHTNVGAIVRSASALGIDALLLDPELVRPALPPLAAHLDGRGAEPPPRAHRAAARRPRAAARSGLRRRRADAGRRRRRHRERRARRGTSASRSCSAPRAPGLSPAVLAEADVRVRIPLAAGVDSLNVAAAAAIAFYALRPDSAA